MPDQTMIERVARTAAAEFERQAAAGDIVADSSVVSTTSMDAGCQFIQGEVNLRSMARAVLTAMREPTDQMVDAGFDTELDEDGDMAPRLVWSAMIDAADPWRRGFLAFASLATGSPTIVTVSSHPFAHIAVRKVCAAIDRSRECGSDRHRFVPWQSYAQRSP